MKPLMFPKRGKPPKCPIGYDPDPNDPFVFWPIWEECCHRGERAYRCTSGALKTVPHCMLLQIDLKFEDCEYCDKIKKPDT